LTGNTGTVSALGTSNFGQLVVASSSITLPIKLLSFEANKNGDKVDLKWVTAVEINNDHFNLERSQDGIHFESIQELPGAGNSNYNITYNATDNAPLFGNSIYRIKQTDFDGKFTYSEMRYINNQNSNPVKTFSITDIGPNPFSSKVQLTVSESLSGPTTIQLSDMTGRVVYSNTSAVEEGKNTIVVSDLPELPAGNYLLMVSNQNATETKRLIHN